ncbi:LPXTG cell wall anchor domain-containing protein [Clostridium nigeriense]
MEKVANLFSIKVSSLLIGVGLIIIIALAIVIYMKKRNSEQF